MGFSGGAARSGLTLRDPSGMGLEDREHLLLLQNPLALKQPAVDEISLLLRMVQEMPDLPDTLLSRLAAFPGHNARRRLREPDQPLAPLRIRLDLLRLRPRGPADTMEPVPDAVLVIPRLAPAWQTLHQGFPRRHPNQRPHMASWSRLTSVGW